MNNKKTCLDCIYYPICFDIGASRYDNFDDEFGETVCIMFKDKSKFIEFPCAIGDTVYVYFHGYIEQDHVIGFEILNGKIQLITSICKFKLGRTAK